MRALSSDELREIFVKYFTGKGHTLVPSSSLIPAGDDSIMFTNAGMVQFKDYFTGAVAPAMSRAVTVQKCMRAGGKHNDLENVGKTSRHHTFFEMLGNFSFGDYFKKDAVLFAYEFLKDVLELDFERIYITVNAGDEEGYNIWKNDVGIRADKIYKLGDETNFWQMGETGPCGYSSEIFFDTGYSEAGHKDCGINCDCGRYLEIWNLVFMEFNKKGGEEGEKLVKLPKPSIDTGMGLERMLRILQNVRSNYDTDVFMPYINEIDGITGKKYNAGDENYDTAVRVISDHIRTSVFLSAEYVFPSNEGRGYVFRRILRRLIRYSLELNIGLENLIYLGNTVIIVMGGFYPESLDGLAVLEKTISEEYEKFTDTVRQGIKLLNEKIAGIKNKKGKIVPGDFVFKLYDEKGFPVDLAVDIAEENELSVDLKTFDELMDIQKKGSKQKKEKHGIPNITFGLPKTDFTGYKNIEKPVSANITGIFDGHGEPAADIESGDFYYISADSTPFYPEGGGQTGDKGTIKWSSGGASFSASVSEVYKTKNGVIIHHGRVFKEGEAFSSLTFPVKADFAVEIESRRKTSANHSAIHLLQASLRKIFGSRVSQQGSYVDSERLRFDFSYGKSLSDEEIRKIETAVNEYIFADINVRIDETDVKTALNSGALHFFDEKYEDKVRIVSMDEVSKEFCGGTHVSRTGEIGFFKILGEFSVASGIRRIEAITGLNYLNYLYVGEDNINNIVKLLNCSKADVYNKIIKLHYDYEFLEKANAELQSKLNSFEAERLVKQFKTTNGGTSYLASKFQNVSVEELKELANALKMRHDFPRGAAAVVFASNLNGEKLVYIVSAFGGADASGIIKRINSEFGGKGGGKKDFSQGGSADVSKFEGFEKIAGNIISEELFAKAKI